MKWLEANKHHKCTSSTGFTLIEVMASVLLIAMFGMSLFLIIGSMDSDVKLGQQKSEAFMLANNTLSSFVVNGQTGSQTVSVNGTSFTVTSTVTQTTATSESLEVIVTWQNQHQQQFALNQVIYHWK